jgi:transketolase
MIEPPTWDLQALQELARRIRLDVLDMTATVGGHVSSCFSAVEILTAIYFGEVLRHSPDDPVWPERDRFILSKGHAAPAFYSVLAHAGYFPVAELKHFRHLDHGLHGHPIGGTLPGVEMTGGSLGQGLSFGLGHLLAGRLSGLDYRVYVLLGDGECEEGQIWEAAMAAAHWQADRLIAIVDHNKYQQTGPISREMSLAPFADKWRSFGWHVEEVDGHDIAALIETLRKVSPPLKSGEGQGAGAGRPAVIIAHTVKGKGVSFIERDYSFHGRSLDPEQDAQAREEILCG